MLGDRRLHITVARVWGNLSYWDKLRLVSTLLYTGILPASKEEMTKEMEKMKVSQLSCVSDLCWSICLAFHHHHHQTRLIKIRFQLGTYGRKQLPPGSPIENCSVPWVCYPQL